MLVFRPILLAASITKKISWSKKQVCLEFDVGIIGSRDQSYQCNQRQIPENFRYLEPKILLVIEATLLLF